MMYLILFLISFSASANFVKVSDIESGLFKTVFTKKKRCGADCIRIPVGFNKAFHQVADGMENDFEKPIYSKTLPDSCSGQNDCEAKQLLKLSSYSCGEDQDCLGRRCSPNDSVLINAEYTETYCSRLSGYQQKLSGRKIVIENPALKEIYLASSAAKKAAKEVIDSKVSDMDFGKRLYAYVQVMNKSKGLSKAVRKQLRKDLATIRDDLFDGAICDAGDGIAALTADGTVIKQSDLDSIAAKIAAFKTCP